MRNLKRALSLALAAAMLVSLMVVGASAADYGDAAQVSQTEAVEVLTGIGVVGGDQNGNFNPTATLTRAEFCVMIANALTGGTFDRTLFEGTITPFTDVTGHWGEAYIAYCYANGIIAGTSATTFSPDATLTSAQAAAILLMALGYNQDNEFAANGQFELNVTRWAQQTGLYNDLSVSASAGISRENTAKLIFNSLTEAVPVSYSASFDIYYNANGSWTNGVQFAYDETLGFKNFDLVYKTVTDDLGQANTRWGVGSVAGNYLDAKGNLVSTAVTIADRDKIADVEDTPILTYTSDMTKADNVADINRAIRGYDATKGVTVTVNGDDNTQTGITAAQIAGYTGDGYTVKVYANNSGVITSVSVIMEELAKVISVNTTKNEITLMTSEGNVIIDEDHDSYDDLAGAVANGDYVLAVVNADTGDVEAAYVGKTVTGVVTSYTNKNALTVGGVQYKPSKCADETGDLTAPASYTNTTDSCTLYLDSNGYVIGVDSSARIVGENICFVVYAQDVGNWGAAYEAYVYLPDGTKGVYTIASYNNSTKASEIAKVTTGLYVYTLDGSDIRLKDDSSTSLSNSDYDLVTNDDAAVQLDKDQARYTVGGETVYLNAETKFYMHDTTKGDPISATNASASGLITVSTGLSTIKNVELAKDDMTVAYRDVNGRNIATAVYGSYAGSVSAASSDLVFITGSNWSKVNADNDEYKVTAIFTGETEAQTITIKGEPTMGLYSYKETNGVYELSTPENCDYQGQLEKVTDKLLYVGGTQLNNLDKAVVIDSTGNDPVQTAASYLDANNVAFFGYAVVDNSSDKNVLAVYITHTAKAAANTSVSDLENGDIVMGDDTQFTAANGWPTDFADGRNIILAFDADKNDRATVTIKQGSDVKYTETKTAANDGTNFFYISLDGKNANSIDKDGPWEAADAGNHTAGEAAHGTFSYEIKIGGATVASGNFMAD